MTLAPTFSLPISRSPWKLWCLGRRRIASIDQPGSYRGDPGDHFGFIGGSKLLRATGRERVGHGDNTIAVQFAPGAYIAGPQFQKPDGAVVFGTGRTMRL